MSEQDDLQAAYPALERRLPRLAIALLPTPVRTATLNHASGNRCIIVKQDNLSGSLYGGNKVRKLEYLLARAALKKRRTIATFGTVGSHHALATALYAREHGFDCIAFLSHQTRTASVSRTLNTHLEIGTSLVPFTGNYAKRIATLRRHLRGRRAAVVPVGGSSWLGTVGFVNAALELAAQIGRGECALPDRLYVATGTMGTAAGLALGFALAGVPIEVHAIRISAGNICNEEKLLALATKTAAMLNRLDSSIPQLLASDIRLVLRHEFFGDGYAQTNATTERAIGIAARDLNLTLEPTYTGKAMAALLHDLRDDAARGKTFLFWQSYHAAPLSCGTERPADNGNLPPEFGRYFD